MKLQNVHSHNNAFFQDVYTRYGSASPIVCAANRSKAVVLVKFLL